MENMETENKKDLEKYKTKVEELFKKAHPNFTEKEIKAWIRVSEAL